MSKKKEKCKCVDLLLKKMQTKKKKAIKGKKNIKKTKPSSPPSGFNINIPNQNLTKDYSSLERKLDELLTKSKPLEKKQLSNTFTQTEEPNYISIKTQTEPQKKSLIIQEDIGIQTDNPPEYVSTESSTDVSIPLREFRQTQIPRYFPKNKEPTIAEIKQKWIEITGDKEEAKGINKSNKQMYIEKINKKNI
jgi:hypothetical protein